LPNSATVEAGEILFDGCSLLNLPEAKLRSIRGDKISLVPQEPALALNPVMTVGTQIAEVLRAHLSISRRERRERVGELLRGVGFDKPDQIASAYPHPQAKILPLKAFHSDGTGYDSDVLRAIYYAVAHGAKVMNMSFDYSTYSPELARAIKYANGKGVVSVASAGNDGLRTVVYPAALPGVVNVASTSNNDIQSTFTNYGAPPVWIAAPGEGVVTTYPWGTYAAGWGTSFSTPLTAGTAALMLGTNGGCTHSGTIPLGLAAADYIGDIDMGFGRLDTYQSVLACRILH
jgi:hypothetical protein